MGNQINPSIETFNRKDWNLVSNKDGIETYQNRQQSDIKVDSYPITVLSSNQQEKIQKMYRIRHKSPNLVAAFVLDQHNNDDFCSSQSKYDLILEHIPIRLSDIQHTPFSDTLHTYYQAIIGYYKLYQQFGPFGVNQDCIGINEQGVVKVWIDQDFSKSGVRKSNISEESMLRNVIQIVERSSDNINNPPNIPLFSQFLFGQKKAKSFGQASTNILEYAGRYNSGQIPDHLQCIDKVGGVQTILLRDQQRNSQQVISSKQGKLLASPYYHNQDIQNIPVNQHLYHSQNRQIITSHAYFQPHFNNQLINRSVINNQVPQPQNNYVNNNQIIYQTPQHSPPIIYSLERPPQQNIVVSKPTYNPISDRVHNQPLHIYKSSIYTTNNQQPLIRQINNHPTINNNPIPPSSSSINIFRQSTVLQKMQSKVNLLPQHKSQVYFRTNSQKSQLVSPPLSQNISINNNQSNHVKFINNNNNLTLLPPQVSINPINFPINQTNISHKVQVINHPTINRSSQQLIIEPKNINSQVQSPILSIPQPKNNFNQNVLNNNFIPANNHVITNNITTNKPVQIQFHKIISPNNINQQNPLNNLNQTNNIIMINNTNHINPVQKQIQKQNINNQIVQRKNINQNIYQSFQQSKQPIQHNYPINNYSATSTYNNNIYQSTQNKNINQKTTIQAYVDKKYQTSQQLTTNSHQIYSNNNYQTQQLSKIKHKNTLIQDLSQYTEPTNKQIYNQYKQTISQQVIKNNVTQNYSYSKSKNTYEQYTQSTYNYDKMQSGSNIDINDGKSSPQFLKNLLKDTSSIYNLELDYKNEKHNSFNNVFKDNEYQNNNQIKRNIRQNYY